MSNIALFLATGIVVRKNGKNRMGESYVLQPTINNTFLTSSDGRVTEFNISFQNTTKKFIYVAYEHLLERDKNNKSFKSFEGFCSEQKFAEYKNYLIGVDAFMHNENWFDSNFQLAFLGDIITIEALDLTDLYKYYVNKKYTFDIIDTNIDFGDPLQYPANTTVEIQNYDLLQTPSGKFYTKNINKISTITNIDQKTEYAKLLTNICFRVYYIGNGILEKLAMKSIDTIILAFKNKYVNNDSILYNKLEKIDQLVGELLKDWGFITGVEPSYIFENKEISYINSYLDSLNNFYNTLKSADESKYFPYDSYGNPQNFQGYNITHDQQEDENGNIIHVSQEIKDKKDSERRIFFLFNYLTTEGLGAFSYDQRFRLLIDLVKKNRLEQKPINDLGQNNVIKLLNTFVNSAECDGLLNYLLEADDGKITNFEILYNKLDDGRLERYPIISWFVDQTTNRMFYIYTIYNAWKLSKYSFYSSGSNMYRGINLDCYFLNAGKKYYPQYNNQNKLISGSTPILNFVINKLGNDGSFSESSYSPRANLEKEMINIDQVTTNITYNTYDTHGDGVNKTETKSFFGKYHLFQSITLLGYKGTYEINTPNSIPIPAFLFYYTNDFIKLKLFDAALSFTIQLGIEIAAFFAFGGANVIKSLEYLKYTSNLYKVFTGTANAGEAVLFYKGASVASELYTLSASIMGSYMQYLSDSALTQEEKEYYAKISMYLLTSTLFGAYISGVARSKVNNLIDDIITDPLYAQFKAQFPDINSLITQTKGISISEMADFRAKYIAGRPKLRVVFDSSAFTDDLKIAFFKEYEAFQEIKIWDDLNNADNALTNWRNLYNQNIYERLLPSVIKNNVTTETFLKYYASPELRSIIEGVKHETRISFILHVKTEQAIFDKFNFNPNTLKTWFKHYEDSNSKNFFMQLASTRQIEIIERYSGNNMLFSRIQNQPDIILSFNKYSSEQELIDRIKNYSNTPKEEIIFFERYNSKNTEWFNFFKANPDEIIFELGLYSNRTVKSINNFKYEILTANNEIDFNVLKSDGIISAWSNKATKTQGVLSFDFNTSMLADMGYNVSKVGQRWVDDAFELWGNSITKVKTVWTHNQLYPGGSSLGYKQFTSVFDDTYDEIEAVKSTTFYKTMQSKGFSNIEKVDMYNYEEEIIVILKK